jgi:hypothetical protein
MSFPITVRKNQAYSAGSEVSRYFLEVDLGEVAPGRKALLPVQWRSNSSHPLLKEIYQTEVGGFRVERGNLPSLLESVRTAIEGMKEDDTLPYYSIILPNGNRIPIFLVKSKLQARVLRAKIEGREISEIFEKIRERLISNGMLKKEWELKVDIFLWQDLKLYPPAFILKDLGARVWIPVFCSKMEGRHVINYDVLNKPSQLMEIEESIKLRDRLANSMMSEGRVGSPDQIYMDQTQDMVWKKVRKGLRDTGEVLAYESAERRIEMPIYESEDRLITAQRPKVFFGKNTSRLISTVANVLRKEGAIRSSVSLRLEESRRN